MNRADIEDRTNTNAIIIVVTNIIFSGPLFVRKFEVGDPPPDQAPRPASLCCRRISPTKTADSIT